jgi:sugar lactone lactonase YvrE
VVGVAVDGDENVYACDMKKRAVLRIDSTDRTISTFCDTVEGTQLLTPNFGVFHPSGDFYFTDSGDYGRATGRLIRVHGDGTSESLLGRHLNFPNGLALSSDATTLYMVESTSSKISRMRLEDDGSLASDPETYGQLQGTVPDGMAFDKLGNLFIGCYTPDVILKIDVSRNVSTVIEDRTAEVLNRPTNVAFRPGMHTELYFANLGGWNIGSLDVGMPGQRLNYPKRK